MTACPIRYQRQVPDRKGKIFYIFITSLSHISKNRGHIVTYDAVCEAVWGADYYGYENSLNVHIRHLREKLEPNPSKPQYLLTVRGIGYKLAEENAQ